MKSKFDAAKGKDVRDRCRKVTIEASYPPGTVQRNVEETLLAAIACRLGGVGMTAEQAKFLGDFAAVPADKIEGRP